MLPDFLGIGAQRAGTTWLHENLRAHPDLWLPPVKEVHYFDRCVHHPSPLSRRFYDGRWFRQLGRRLRARWAERDLGGLGWEWNYFFRHRSLRWYRAVFEPGRGRRCGDVTPAYSILAEAEVARVHELLPEARILFLMRDPIERAWSGLRMAAERRGLDLADRGRIARYCEAQRALRGDYLRTLKNWERFYPAERFFVGFFDELEADPEGLLLALLRFLGVRVERELLPPGLHARRNASAAAALPEALARHLAELYVDDLEVLNERFAGPVALWLDRARSILRARRIVTLSGESAS